MNLYATEVRHFSPTFLRVSNELKTPGVNEFLRRFAYKSIGFDIDAKRHWWSVVPELPKHFGISHGDVVFVLQLASDGSFYHVEVPLGYYEDSVPTCRPNRYSFKLVLYKTGAWRVVETEYDEKMCGVSDTTERCILANYADAKSACKPVSQIKMDRIAHDIVQDLVWLAEVLRIEFDLFDLYAHGLPWNDPSA